MNVVFLNSSTAQCSIHESGRMVADCLAGSDHYHFTYATIDQLDAVALEDGRIAWRKGLANEPFGRIDAVVVNWHIVTMPLSHEVVSRLPGVKFAIVLEAAPGDPLALTPVKTFDAYLVLDPTLTETNKVLAFPRPLNGVAFTRRTQPNSVVRIGSFGFGTPGKGFELVVEAANREFDRAEIVINVPQGDFVAFDAIHDESYVEHIARTLQAIAKPGIDVRVTSNYYSQVELIEWCDANDLNCFMYTREQPGLSATTDQAIISGRPLLTIGNPTFRHITRYIAPYPRQSMHDAIAGAASAVQAMQQAWSPAAFRAKFEQVLQRRNRGESNAALQGAGAQEPRIDVATLGVSAQNDGYAYAARVTAALNRSGEFDARNVSAESVSDLLSGLLKRRPTYVLLIGESDQRRRAAAIARLLLPYALVVEAGWTLDSQDEFGFQLRPIIPFHTVNVPLSFDPAIIMIGFAGDHFGTSRALRILARDDPDARVLIDAPAQAIEAMQRHIAAEKATSRSIGLLRIDVLELPKNANQFIEFVAQQRAIVAQADRHDEHDLLNKLSLANISERPILISTERPVRFFSDKTSRLGAVNLFHVERFGVAGRIGCIMDFGEWAFVEALRVHIEREAKNDFADAEVPPGLIDHAVFGLLPWKDFSDHGDVGVSASNQSRSQRVIRHLLADLRGLLEGSDRHFVARLYRVALSREPDHSGFEHHVEALWRGAVREGVVAGFLTSAERQMHADRLSYWKQFPNLLLELPSLPLLIGWLDGLLSLSGDKFVIELRQLNDKLGLTVSETRNFNSPVDRIAVLVELSEKCYSACLDDDSCTARTWAWSRLCDKIQSGDMGVLHELPALPSTIRKPIDRSVRDEFHAVEQSGYTMRRRATNIFGEPQPTRRLNGAEPKASEIRTVYLLVGPHHSATPGYIANLALYWPEGTVTLQMVAWNRALRRLQLIGERKDGVDIPEFCDRHCGVLIIPGDLIDGEPMGAIAPISEARRRGWTVAALVGAGSPSSLDATADPIARQWRAFGIVDQIIATSGFASRQIKKFLEAERGQVDNPPIVVVSDLGPSTDEQTRFAFNVLTSILRRDAASTLPASVIYRHDGVESASACIVEMGKLGLSLVEWTDDADFPTFDLSPNHGPRWILADNVQSPATLTRMRDFAAELGAQTVYLGSIPGEAESLRAELLEWDLVAVTRPSDFNALARWMRQTRRRICDAETRFILLDHPGEWTPHAQKESTEAPRFRVAVPAGLTVGLSIVDAEGRPVELVEVLVGSDASRFGDDDAIDACLALGSYEQAIALAEAAARAGVPILVRHLNDIPPRPGVVLLPQTGSAAITLPPAAAIAAASRDLRIWTARVRMDAANELAASLARATSRTVFIPAERPLSPGGEQLSRPLLSLCISTYNRAGWLALNLRNIYQQIDANNAEIEVVVVDNCSADDTPEVCAAYEPKSNFRVVRNEVNVGMLGNLSVAAQHARGHYIWVLGDDDLTREGVIAKVCKILEEDPALDLVYLNYGYTSIDDPSAILDPKDVTEKFNILEPGGPDRRATVSELAAGSENFYTAIYAIVYRREHGFRAYCQDTSGRPFSSLSTCVPTAKYALAEMAQCKAYWIGAPSLVVNSNVSWQAYGPLFDLEQLPRVWDLAEVGGSDPEAVDTRRASRLWLVEMMWRDMLLADKIGNQVYFNPERVLMRLKHLPEIDQRIGALREIYEEAFHLGQPAAKLAPERLFEAWTR